MGKLNNFWNHSLDSKLSLIIWYVLVLIIVGFTLETIGISYFLKDFIVIFSTVIIALELADRLYFSKPSLDIFFYFPEKDDGVSVSYEDECEKTQKLIHGAHRYLIRFKERDIKRKGKIFCFGINNKGKKLDSISIYLSSSKIANKKIKFIAYRNKWYDYKSKNIITNPKGDIYISSSKSFPVTSVLVLPFKALIPKCKNKYSISVEVNSSNTARPFIKYLTVEIM